MNIKEKYNNYFKKNHVFLEQPQLIINDKTTLFKSSRIQQLISYIVAEEKHQYWLIYNKSI